MTALTGAFVVADGLAGVDVELVLVVRDPEMFVCCLMGIAFPSSIFLRIGGGDTDRVKEFKGRFPLTGVASLRGSFVTRIPVKAAGLTVSRGEDRKSSFSLSNFCLFLLPPESPASA
jgi:hypothetical protein